MKYSKLLLIGLFTLGTNLCLAASFNCSKATSLDEKTVCKSQELSDLDVEMSVKYNWIRSLMGMGNRDNLGMEQRQFLKNRKSCKSNVSCIKTLYKKRIAELDAIYDRIEKPIL